MSKKSEYNKYLESEYWQGIRKSIYKRDNYKCRLCNSDKDICVHHRTYEHIGNEILEELITMCRRCHHRFHKINPETSYTYYINQIENEKLKLKRDNDILLIEDFINNNNDKFVYLTETINTYNYMKFKDFVKELVTISENKFDKSLFITYCINYLGVVNVTMYGKNMRDKYNLPTNRDSIIINSSTYNEERNNFIIIHCP